MAAMSTQARTSPRMAPSVMLTGSTGRFLAYAATKGSPGAPR